MLAQPTLLSTSRDADGTVELQLRVPASLRYFPDHFPSHPMTPGVVQLGWAIEFAQHAFGITLPFRKVGALKFQNPILPESHVTLRLTRSAENQVVFNYTSSAKEYSGGKLSFADAHA